LQSGALADRRARALAISASARGLLPLLRNIVGESLREALRGLSTDETAILVKALQRVITNLSAIDHRAATDSRDLRRNH
jgi:DNA-binding MarR family transcriptional regulator